jgi:hypothetical protein
MSVSATLHLAPHFFTEKEKLLLEAGQLSASALLYNSGVCGLRLKNAQGEIVTLPFQGQQIWSATFGGRPLTMKSMFTDPRNTRDYIANYGGFLLHCGMTAMGVPSKEDSHPLHGELPHAPYSQAYVALGADEGGDYIGLGGLYQHTLAFSTNYIAEPLIKLYADSGLIHIAMTVTNLRSVELEYMYMAHVNFRPVDNGRLVYSAPATPDYIVARRGAPHLKFKPEYKEFIEDLALHPEKHHILEPGKPFDPEVVLYIRYLADQSGWAHSMQILPDGGADYIRHRPAQLDHGVRWISRIPDQDALGLILPATAEADGYTMEKAKGNIKVLPAKGQFHCEIVAGALSATEAQQMEAQIKGIVAGH